MNVEALIRPISQSSPAGESCSDDRRFVGAVALVEFVGFNAHLEELRRVSTMAEAGLDEESRTKRESNEAKVAQFKKSELEKAEAQRRSLHERAKSLAPGASGPDQAAEVADSWCQELLSERGKDLRVVSVQTLAMTHLRGLSGLIDGIALFDGLLSAYPGTVHPVPDMDDPDGDLVRLRALDGVTRNKSMRSLLRESVLLTSTAGSLRFRDAEVLNQSLPPDPSGQSVSGRMHVLDIVRDHVAHKARVKRANVSDAQLRDQLRELLTQLDAAIATLTRLTRGLAPDRVDVDLLPQLLVTMSELLGSMHDELTATAASRTVKSLIAAGSVEAHVTSAPSASVVELAAPAAGLLRNRDDARRMILQIAAFVEATLPGHPAPLFLKRAEKLLSATNFFEIVEDMFEPDMKDHIERLTGQKSPLPDRSNKA